MKIKVICGAVIVKDEQLVIVQEAKGYIRGKWNIPAGHLENDENLINGAIREAKEETGLDIEIDGLIGVYQHESNLGNNIVAFYFKATPKNIKLDHDANEILDSQWISFENFLNFDDKKIRVPTFKKIVSDYLNKGTENNIIHISGV